MIAGVGHDVCQIARMEELLHNTHFLDRYFSPEEQVYIRSKGQMAAASMAGIFAAKEALVKALGTGFTSTCLSDITILHHPSGAPYYDLRGGIASQIAQLGIGCVHLSISHDGGIASAVAIAERADT